jgi:hypothetical protein
MTLRRCLHVQAAAFCRFSVDIHKIPTLFIQVLILMILRPMTFLRYRYIYLIEFIWVSSMATPWSPLAF